MNSIITDNIFYVYIYKHPITLEPFYVGKGYGNRATRHLQMNKNKGNKYFYNTINKIINECKCIPIIEYYKNNISEIDALKIEIELIEKYGRKLFDINGKLCNLTTGGDGISGYKWTEEQKLKIKNKKRGPMPLKTKEALYKANKGRKMSKESVEKSVKSKLKTFIIITPDNKKMSIQNLTNFCIDNNLLVSAIRGTLKTKKPVRSGPSKGWMLMNSNN